MRFLILFSFVSITVSCDKENISNDFAPFYKFTVNGDKKAIDACGSSDYVAEYLKDTAIFAAFGCGGERAGFYIKSQIKDGIHVLDNNNTAWYDQGIASYRTDSLNKGTLTIKTGYFQAAGGLIPFVEGEFSFDAIDKKTGQKIKVTNGKYLLKKH